MEIELRHLRIVVAIAECGSVSGAAAQLGYSQPGLSYTLRRLEMEVGKPLFLRSHRGVRATYDGDVFVARARSVLRSMREFEDALADSGRRALRLGGNSNPVFAAALSVALRDLGRPVHGHAETSSKVLTELLVGGTLDAISVGVYDGIDTACPPGFSQASYVDAVPFLVAMSANSEHAAHNLVDLSHLRDEAWIMPGGEPDGTMTAVTAAFAEAGFVPHAPLGRASLGDIPAWLRDGVAVAFTTPSYVPGDGIVVRPLRGKPVSGRLVVRWNPRTVSEQDANWYLQTLVSSYVQHVEETVARLAWWEAAPDYRPTLNPELAERLGLSWSH